MCFTSELLCLYSVQGEENNLNSYSEIQKKDKCTEASYSS